eukprot:scaffold447102_cov18-Prasinocladus_malaysianus.AAC.1
MHCGVCHRVRCLTRQATQIICAVKLREGAYHSSSSQPVTFSLSRNSAADAVCRMMCCIMRVCGRCSDDKKLIGFTVIGKQGAGRLEARPGLQSQPRLLRNQH